MDTAKTKSAAQRALRAPKPQIPAKTAEPAHARPAPGTLVYSQVSKKPRAEDVSLAVIVAHTGMMARDFFSTSAADIIAQTRNGLPATFAVDFAAYLNMPQDTFFSAVGLPKSTIRNRITQGKPLSASEGDRLYRVSRVVERAVAVIEDRESANAWLQRKNRSLGGVSPLSLLDTEAGYELVMDTLGRIEQGVVA